MHANINIDNWIHISELYSGIGGGGGIRQLAKNNSPARVLDRSTVTLAQTHTSKTIQSTGQVNSYSGCHKRLLRSTSRLLPTLANQG